MEHPSVIQLRHVAKSYPGVIPAVVLKDASLEVAAGESIAIVGPSGSGKSTILNLLGGLDRPDSGTVQVLGKDLAGLGDNDLAELRNRRIGYVFQQHHLLPQCTVLENILVPVLATTNRAGKEDCERAERLIRRVGMSERIHHLPGQLSGGERQRVALVRALIRQPDIVLADEPTGALDQANGLAVADLLVELNREEKTTLVVVTHSPELARRLGRIVTLKEGRLL